MKKLFTYLGHLILCPATLYPGNIDGLCSNCLKKKEPVKYHPQYCTGIHEQDCDYPSCVCWTRITPGNSSRW